MKKMLKRLCTGFLALATVVTALPTTPVHAESKQYWTESKERVGIVEKVMNDGSIGSTFNEGHLTVEGEDAYCIDINTDFKNGYKTRADVSTRMSADQISDVALSIEYVKQYTDSHSGISKNHAYLLRQLVVWQRLSVHLGWQCDNVRASYDEIPKATQDEVFSGAKAFVKENKGRYECGGYIYSGEGQELGQFWAKLNVGNTKLQKVSSNASITDGNGNYSIAGATYGVFSDKDCTKQLATLTTDENGNTDIAKVKAGTVYIKELYAPAGYKVDKTVYSLKVEVGKTAILKVSDTPKVTDTLIELFKIDMETQKDNPQGNASLAGAEFTWKYYAGFYNKDNLPAEATRTWVTKTTAETDSDGTTHYITKLADTYKVSGDSFYMQDGKAVLPLGTLTVEETKAPNGYLLEGAYMQAGDKSEDLEIAERHLIVDTKEDTTADYEQQFLKDMEDKFIEVNENGEDVLQSYRINMRGTTVEEQNSMTAMIASICLYIAFVLISAVGTILAVQSLSDSTKYKYRYSTLRRIGVNDKSLFRTIKKQLLILFGVPTVYSIICGFFMVVSMNNIFQILLQSKYSYLAYFIGSLLIFFFIYGIYWIATYIGFKRNINEES